MAYAAAAIPLPEHPRPDFERTEWLNLNGPWSFWFDPQNVGEKEQWVARDLRFSEKIMVPFPWGSKLSGVENQADIGWYARPVRLPANWQGKRIFLVVGACDWLTTGWLDGERLGQHRGGYTPFEFELTKYARFDAEQRLVLRVDDTPHPFKLIGKQGYGAAKGIWQTIYLEARSQTYLQTVQFTPDIDRQKVTVKATLNEPAPTDLQMEVQFKNAQTEANKQAFPKGQAEIQFDISLPNSRLWTLNDPFLYEIQAALTGAGGLQDAVQSYFGMRKISVALLPGSDHPYIALNHQPVYLQMTLDQAYHPDGFYTFPSDEFMRDEILRSRRIGLNAMRIHVKIEAPRKLYWADRLGMLIMADVPNSWGPPDDEMRREAEYALRGMIRRDYNHPSIFSWVVFNETWGLNSKDKGYLPETQEWVASMYRLARQLDGSRLVEDNSPCLNDHVITDINSWHAYLPGYAWRESLDQVCRDTFKGSKWNYIGGRQQEHAPLLNSECGNVWGYDGSTGDVDWTWDYHIMMNEFRRHPKICGWLYTEHHDVINEWNGYYRFDRSEKHTGLGDLVPGMTLNDWHGPFYISTGSDLCRTVKPGEQVTVPLWASFLTASAPCQNLVLRTRLSGWDSLGRRLYRPQSSREVVFRPWLSQALEPLSVEMPAQSGLCLLTITLEDGAGTVLHRNFTCFAIRDGAAPRDEALELEDHRVRVVRFAPGSFTQQKWSLKQWNVLNGLKVNGAGHGFFEYRVRWPEGLKPDQVGQAVLRLEASAKQLFGKDQKGSAKVEGDFMQGKGTLDPSLNPNSYPMTDSVRFPSSVQVRVAGHSAGIYELPDDPADHQGILSWAAQPRNRKLDEAGSYGYLLNVVVPSAALKDAATAGELVIRLEVDQALPGGLALYGEQFGRYPLDPTLIFHLK